MWQRRGAAGGWQEQTGQRLGAILVGVMTAAAIFAVLQLVDAPLRSVGWALAGLVFLVVGFVVRTRAYRLGGLVAIGFALARVIIHDFGQFSTPYRILSSLALGVILLLLAYLYTRNREKLARWL